MHSYNTDSSRKSSNTESRRLYLNSGFQTGSRSSRCSGLSEHDKCHRKCSKTDLVSASLGCSLLWQDRHSLSYAHQHQMYLHPSLPPIMSDQDPPRRPDSGQERPKTKTKAKIVEAEREIQRALIVKTDTKSAINTVNKTTKAAEKEPRILEKGY